MYAGPVWGRFFSLLKNSSSIHYYIPDLFAPQAVSNVLKASDIECFAMSFNANYQSNVAGCSASRVQLGIKQGSIVALVHCGVWADFNACSVKKLRGYLFNSSGQSGGILLGRQQVFGNRGYQGAVLRHRKEKNFFNGACCALKDCRNHFAVVALCNVDSLKGKALADCHVTCLGLTGRVLECGGCRIHKQICIFEPEPF